MNNISSTAAGQRFSELLEKVEQGEGFAITRNGETVARLLPRAPSQAETFDPDSPTASLTDKERKAAQRRLMARLNRGLPLGGGGFNREEFYGRDKEKLIA